jgi:hypothetical protein
MKLLQREKLNVQQVYVKYDKILTIGESMVSKIAMEKAAQAWCKSKTSNIEMDVNLAEAFAEIIEEYREALIWCSASDDFNIGGQARQGYEKIVRPLI